MSGATQFSLHSSEEAPPSYVRRHVRIAGVVLGLGLGAFIDGIVFHMLLQWHHLICFSCHPNATVEEVKKNIFFDGLFHVLAFGLTVLGLGLLWRTLRAGPVLMPSRFLVGALAFGWGMFNLVEGIIDHHIWGIHHVQPGPNQLVWDLGFLALGALLMLGGSMLMRRRRT